MKKILSNPNHVLCMAAVLLIAILCQSSSAEAPALAYIAEDFPEYPFSIISYVSTLPSLAMIIPSLLYPVLRRYFSVRPLFLVGSLLLIIFGVAPAYADSFTTVCVFRFIFGIGMGIMWPLAQSTIVELYSGTRQDTLLGFNSVITACGGVVWGNVGGILALQGWRVAFFTYYIPIVVLVFSFIFLPLTKPLGKKAADSAEADPIETSEPIPGWVLPAVFLLIAYFVFNFCSMTYFTNLAAKVVGEGIGDSANSGFAQSMFTVGSLIIGLAFGIVMRNKSINRYAMPIAWTITVVGFFLVAAANSFVTLCLSSIVQGFGTGMFVPACLNLINRIGGKKKAALLVGFSCALSGLSQFVGPTITNMIVESMGLASGSPCMFLAAAIDCAAAVLCWIIFVPMEKNRRKALAAAEQAAA